MSQDSSKNPVQRGIGWLRGLLARGERAGSETASTGRATDGGDRQRADAASHRGDASEPRSGGPQPTDAAAGAVAATTTDDALDEELAGDRSDFDDAAGTYVEGDDRYDTVSSDPDEVNRLHDAVGGHDDEADDTTDGVIDTTRERDPSRGAIPESGQDIPGASEQDELTAFEGASTEEFAAGGVPESDVTPEDIEAAAEGEDAAGDSPRQVAHQHDTGGTPDAIDPGAAASDRYAEVREFNYGLGDLGVGAGASSDASDAGATTEPEGTGTGSTEAATDIPSSGTSRVEVESASAGDALAQGDEAEAAPGMSEPETFRNVETGTTEPSRSATGNQLDEEMDALGTTLDYDEDEASPYDADEANLSGQEELVVSDSDGMERVTTFQSGTIAHERLLGADQEPGTALDENVDSYADFPDTPEPDDADDSGRDDFSGSDYPSDRRIDPLAGDDAWDAVTPDVDEEGSSAGDLAAAPSDDDLLIADVGIVDATEDGGGGFLDRTIDQDLVGTSDEHVGGEEPDFAETASRGTDETGVEDASASAEALDAAIGGAPDRDLQPSAAEVSDASVIDASAPDTIETSPELGGMGVSDGDSARSRSGRPVPPGAVAGDGTTATPDGYPVKGNANSKIYHLPHFPSYATTKAEFCFATEEDAVAAGYRAPGRRNRGKSRS